MKSIFLISVLFCSSIYAEDFQVKMSGNLLYEYGFAKNTENAKSLGQDWSEENYSSAQANIGLKAYYKKARVDFNWFVRHNTTNLYKDENTQAPSNLFYPQNVIIRDVFKLEEIDQKEVERTESVINQFSYSWIADDFEFRFGRFFIEYGSGHFINPIDPFMLTSPFNSNYLIQQGNDGLSFSLKDNPNHIMNFYLLGDKQLKNSDQISRTIMLDGRLQYNEYVLINYIAGEDQERFKLGFELKVSPTENYDIYTQILRNSQRLDEEDIEGSGLWHYIVGINASPIEGVGLGIEGGKFQKDEVYPEGTYQTSFLPMESYVGIYSSFTLWSGSEIKIDYLFEPDSQLSYYSASLYQDLTKNMQFQVYSRGPGNRSKDDEKYNAQNTTFHELAARIVGFF